MLSNYAIKKMIPRLIVAAILVNSSFWIGALAVDLSNLLGYNLAKIFANIDIGASGVSQFSESWSNVLAVVLVAPAATVALLVAIVAAPMSLLAFAFMILILMIRKALIVLLIVIAPVAFVAYLLPNTEDLFKKWYKMFIALLMVFPITSVVFGASKLASDILLRVASRDYAGDDVQNMLFIIALGVSAVPLFAVPTLLFAALKAIGSIGGKIDAYGNKSLNKATGSAKQRAGDLKKDVGSRFRLAANNSDSRLQNGRVGRLGGKQAARFTRWNTRRGKLREDRSSAANRAEAVSYSEALGEKDENGNYSDRAIRLQTAAAGGSLSADKAGITRAAATATQVGFKQFDEDVSAYKTTMTNEKDEELLRIVNDITASSEQRAAAAGMLMKNGSMGNIHKLHELTEALSSEDEAASAIRKQMIDDMNRTPIGWGASDIAALKRGEATGKASYSTALKGRLRAGKLNDAKWASADPDDQAAFTELATTGKLDEKELQNLVNAAYDSERNSNVAVSDETRAQNAKILAFARKLGTPVTPKSRTSQQQAPTPQPTSASLQGKTYDETDGGLYIPRK